MSKMENKGGYTFPEIVITGAMVAGIIFGANALDRAQKQRILEDGGVIATSKICEQKLTDHVTGREYTVVQETERNPWDNLDYQVRTGKLVLEDR